MELIYDAARFFVGCYFVWSASSKLGDPGKFWAIIMDYRLTNPKQARLLSSIIPPLEFSAGILFASGAMVIVSGATLIFLLLIFTGAIALALRGGVKADCGCSHSNSEIKPSLIARNLLVLSLCVLGIFSKGADGFNESVPAVIAVLFLIFVSLSRFRSFSK